MEWILSVFVIVCAVAAVLLFVKKRHANKPRNRDDIYPMW